MAFSHPYPGFSSPRSALSAIPVITIITFRYLIILVYLPSPPSSIYDSTEEAIKQMVEAIQRMIYLHKSDEKAEVAASIPINPAIKKHFGLQIKTLQNAPSDVDKLGQIIKAKETQREEDIAMHVEDLQKLVTEIKMLKVVLYLVCRRDRSKKLTS